MDRRRNPVSHPSKTWASSLNYTPVQYPNFTQVQKSVYYHLSVTGVKSRAMPFHLSQYLCNLRYVINNYCQKKSIWNTFGCAHLLPVTKSFRASIYFQETVFSPGIQYLCQQKMVVYFENSAFLKFF